MDNMKISLTCFEFLKACQNIYKCGLLATLVIFRIMKITIPESKGKYHLWQDLDLFLVKK